MFFHFRWASFVALVVFVMPLYAINKCISADGTVSYQAMPCQDNATNEALSDNARPTTPGWRLDPRTSIMVSESHEGVSHRIAHESITVRDKYTILGVDHRSSPIRIWEYHGEDNPATFVPVKCKSAYTKLEGELKRFAMDTISEMKGSALKQQMIAGATHRQWFVMKCDVGGAFVSEGFTLITVPDAKTCPTVWGLSGGGIAAGHIGLFNLTDLVILSLPLADSC